MRSIATLFLRRDLRPEPINSLMRNYTEYEFDLEMMGLVKGPARILDYSSPGAPDWQICKNYSFMNWERCELNTSGFNMESIDWLMQ